jgi:hypothetical protein
VHWDKYYEILEQEKQAVKKKDMKLTFRCCGNSPGKSHTRVHDTDEFGNRLFHYPKVTRTTPKKVLQAKVPERKLSQIINI